MEPTESTEPIVLSGEEFLKRVEDEIERSKRYEHPFTVLTMRPPANASDLGKLDPAWLESEASGLTRGCDVVMVLENGPELVVMLPETDVSGGGQVLERLRDAVGDVDRKWECGLFQYPQNQSQLASLMKQAA